MLFAGYLAAVALAFQSPEYSLLLALALSGGGVRRTPQPSARLVTLLLGLILGTVGTDRLAGVHALHPGPARSRRRAELRARGDGHLCARRGVAHGACATMHASRPRSAPVIWCCRSRCRTSARVVGRSSVLGFLIGVLPGAGATLASFFAWDLEKRIGRGSREAGVAAPEAANNAASTGSFVPLLTLGIPGSGTTAVLLGVMLSYGLQPGPRLLADQPDVFWGVIVSMFSAICFCCS